jgi:hypothetical protein
MVNCDTDTLKPGVLRVFTERQRLRPEFHSIESRPDFMRTVWMQ